MNEPIFTIGHSTRTLGEFLELLHAADIRLIVDVRRLPGSTRYPWFDEDQLSASLAQAGIDYWHAEGLTGRRPVSHDLPFTVNAWWQNRSFHNYADYALSPQFAQALTELSERGSVKRAAVMCSEAVWWRCHRRIIADHLLAHGRDVRHIMGTDHTVAASLSRGAIVGPDKMVTYPAVFA